MVRLKHEVAGCSVRPGSVGTVVAMMPGATGKGHPYLGHFYECAFQSLNLPDLWMMTVLIQGFFPSTWRNPSKLVDGFSVRSEWAFGKIRNREGELSL